MKKLNLSPSERLGSTALCAGLCLFGGGLVQTQAQLTPGQKKQLGDFFGNRAEVGVILGASDSASGGNYTVDGRRGNEDLDLSLTKVSGSGEFGPTGKLGDSGMTWRPFAMGSFGYLSGNN